MTPTRLVYTGSPVRDEFFLSLANPPDQPWRFSPQGMGAAITPGTA